MITHYDLFAGIGGFSLALEEVFDEPIKHIFCEWEQFPTEVLKKHWPEGIYYGDIADLVADTTIERRKNSRNNTEGRYAELNETLKNQEQGLVIVTGGFPCQPFSAAGKRRGTSDDRYKWPEMFEVIRNVKPDWVIAENVRGLTTWNEGMVLEQVCTDLEGEGYEVQPLIIPAVAVSALHRRDRVWIIANRKHERQIPSEYEERPRHKEALPKSKTSNSWDRNWQEVAFATCHDGMDDGLPRDVGGVPYSYAKWRKEALKAYGNAIVPQVAVEIFRAIKETTTTTNRNGGNDE